VKLPLSWLKSFLDVELDVDQVVSWFNAHGLEVEEVATPGAGIRGVTTARVEAFTPHPDADRLRIVSVFDGNETHQVVCGASNFVVGDIVAHAKPGGFVPGVVNADGTEGMTLEARELRGVASHGMLASAKELGLGDDHKGLLILGQDAPLGVSLTDLAPLGEPVIEIAVQPDRGDHLSVLGVARDLAAIIPCGYNPPPVQPLPTGVTHPIRIATSSCHTFVTVSLNGPVDIVTPLWMKQRLAQAGMRSISPVVDVTNFVMLELGQPLHAFDLDTITGELVVRNANPGETLTTLDGQLRTLTTDDVVIADDNGAVSLAGVMGGERTEVSATTTRVLLEAAVWEPQVIRATARRLGLSSEASSRFERGVDPAGALRAVTRAAELIATITKATIHNCDTVNPVDPAPWATRASVTASAARIAGLIALPLDATAQAALLTRSGCTVAIAADQDTLTVAPPSWRSDLLRRADLSEEIARLHGYDTIPATLPNVGTIGGRSAAQLAYDDALAAALAAGFNEARTRPFVGDLALTAVLPSSGRVRLANPLAQDASAMRPSLVEGLVDALRRNHGQGRPGAALVEIGRIFRPVDDPLAAMLDQTCENWRWSGPDGTALPVQPRTIGVAAHGLRHGPDWLDPDAYWDVDDILAVIDEIWRRVTNDRAVTNRLVREAVVRDGFHPSRSVVLRCDGAEVGFCGQLHPRDADARDLPHPVVVGELVLEPLLQQIAARGVAPIQAVAFPRHPARMVDVAIIAQEQHSFTDIAAQVRAAAGEILDEMWLFDEFRGEQIGAEATSFALRLRLQSAERQLTDDDAEKVINAITTAVAAIGAELRR
jgi:phenylalanyl-tRNA synthetase beta chain